MKGRLARHRSFRWSIPDPTDATGNLEGQARQPKPCQLVLGIRGQALQRLPNAQEGPEADDGV